MSRVRRVVRTKYELDHPNWEKEILDKPVRIDYFDTLMEEVDAMLESL